MASKRCNIHSKGSTTQSDSLYSSSDGGTETSRKGYKHVPSKEGARDKLTETHEQFFQSVYAYTDTLKIEPKKKERIDLLFGRKEHGQVMLASDRRVHRKVGRLCIKKMCREWRRAKGSTRRYFWITVIDDDGVTSDRKPEFNARSFKNRLSKYVGRSLQLNAIGVIELQAVTNWPQGGKGRAFLFHAHILAWTDDPNFTTAAAAKRGRELFTIKDANKSVVIKKVGNSEGDIAHLSYYMFKAPIEGKRAVIKKKKGGGKARHFDPTEEGMRPELCFRLAELLTHFRIQQLVIGIGDEGVAIKRSLLMDLHAWHGELQSVKRDGWPNSVATEEMNYFWEGVREESGKKSSFEPPQFRT